MCRQTQSVSVCWTMQAAGNGSSSGCVWVAQIWWRAVLLLSLCAFCCKSVTALCVHSAHGKHAGAWPAGSHCTGGLHSFSSNSRDISGVVCLSGALRCCGQGHSVRCPPESLHCQSEVQMGSLKQWPAACDAAWSTWFCLLLFHCTSGGLGEQQVRYHVCWMS